MADDQSPRTLIKGVSDDELRAGISCPAAFSNKVLLTTTPSGARLSFLETYGDKVPPVARAAVILSYQDALELRDLITRQLAEIEKDLKAFVAANPPPEEKNG